MSCAHPSPHPRGRQCEAWEAIGLLIGNYEDEHVQGLEEGCIMGEEAPEE